MMNTPNMLVGKYSMPTIPIMQLQFETGKDFYINLICNQLTLADLGTKPYKAPGLQRFKYWGLGAKFYPKQDHEHYDLLQVQYYEMNFIDILKDLNQN
jgi:hypothetical protein